jgi:DNA polymerase V
VEQSGKRLFQGAIMTAAPPVRITGIYAYRKDTEWKIPLYLTRVAAGFPSPADDFLDKKIDLNAELIRHPAATFFVRVQGDSMRDAGIFSGDMLIVDRSLEVKENAVVVAVLDGEFTVKRVQRANGKLYLIPANAAYTPTEVTAERDFTVWGVVTNVVHSFS